jgi:hypothetical protein
MMPTEKTYSSCWVAYFDLLGFGNMVEHCEIWHVFEHYERALDEIKRLGHWTPARWFSDTFVFHTRDDSIDSLGKIAGASEIFFHRMITHLIPIRGCLTYGPLYTGPDDVLFGPALVTAYKEAEAQDWLGFILTPEAEERMKKYEVNGKNVYDVLRQYCYRGFDVPFKESYRKTIESSRRLVYNPCHDKTSLESARTLCDWLSQMQCLGLDIEQGEKKRKHIQSIYENTRAFLIDIVPGLSQP